MYGYNMATLYAVAVHSYRYGARLSDIGVLIIILLFSLLFCQNSRFNYTALPNVTLCAYYSNHIVVALKPCTIVL